MGISPRGSLPLVRCALSIDSQVLGFPAPWRQRWRRPAHWKARARPPPRVPGLLFAKRVFRASSSCPARARPPRRVGDPRPSRRAADGASRRHASSCCAPPLSRRDVASPPSRPFAAPRPRSPPRRRRPSPPRDRQRVRVPVEYPLDSGGAGWDAVDLHARAGLAWSFTTPSSTDGRKIVKAACEARGVSLKGSSNFRKEDWESVAEQADVRLLDTFSTLPGMRGFRACWADHGVALLYVPGVRRFYTVADVAAGVADEKAKKDAAGVIAALEALCRVRPGFAEAYAIATDPAKAAAAAEQPPPMRPAARGAASSRPPAPPPRSGGVRRPADVRRAMVRGTRRGRGDAVRRIRRRFRFPRSRGRVLISPPPPPPRRSRAWIERGPRASG